MALEFENKNEKHNCVLDTVLNVSENRAFKLFKKLSTKTQNPYNMVRSQNMTQAC